MLPGSVPEQNENNWLQERLSGLKERLDPDSFLLASCYVFINTCAALQDGGHDMERIATQGNISSAYTTALRCLRKLRHGPEAYLRLLSCSRDFVDSVDVITLGTMMLEQYPEDVRGYEITADEYIRGGDLAKAVSVLSLGATLTRDKLPLLLKLNDAYRNLGNYNKAASVALTIASLYPNIFDGYARAAQDFISTGEYDKGCRVCEDGLKILPFNKFLLAKSCIAYRSCQRYADSMAMAQALVALHPEFANGYLLLAEDLEKLGHVDEAIKVGRRALEKFSSFIELRVFAANLLLKAGDYEEAISVSDGTIDMWPSIHDGYESKINAFLLAGRISEAIDVAEKGILLATENNLSLLLILSDIYRLAGDRGKAYEVACALLRDFPCNDQGYVRSIEDLVELRDFLTAKQKAKDFRGACPKSIDFLCALISLWRIEGAFNDALADAKAIIDIAPNDWRGYYHAAENLASLGRIDEALSIAKRGLAENEDSINLLRMSSYILALDKKPVSLANNLADAADASISSIIAFSHLADFNSSLYSLQRDATNSSAGFEHEAISAKSYLFVDGIPRSGTTALGDLLNISKEVELYTELYSFESIPAYSKDVFKGSSLRKALYSNRLDANTATKDIAIFQGKHGSARFIGDKRPWFHFCLEAAFDNLSPSEFTNIFIWRDIRMLIRSCISRSRDISDFTWNRDWGGRHMALMCNATARRILFIKRERPDIYSRMLFAQYENIFSNFSTALALFNQIGIHLDQSEIKSVSDFIERSSSLALRKFEVDELGEEVSETIDEYINKDLMREFCDECSLLCFV